MASQSDHDPKQVFNHPPPPPGYGGYPPPMGYHQQGYPPPPPHPNAYNYPYNPYHYHQQQQQLDARASNFVRGVLIGIIFLVVFMAASSIITRLVLRPELPVVHLNTFVVTNFNVSKQGTFVAIFEANSTIENPNTRLKLRLHEVSDSVYYDDHILGASEDVQSFVMGTNSDRLIESKITSNETTPVLEEEEAERMIGERRGGKIVVSYRIAAFAAFRSESWWRRHTILKVYCEDLMVEFGNDNVGSVRGGKDCSVFA